MWSEIHNTYNGIVSCVRQELSLRNPGLWFSLLPLNLFLDHFHLLCQPQDLHWKYQCFIQQSIQQLWQRKTRNQETSHFITIVTRRWKLHRYGWGSNKTLTSVWRWNGTGFLDRGRTPCFIVNWQPMHAHIPVLLEVNKCAKHSLIKLSIDPFKN